MRNVLRDVRDEETVPEFHRAYIDDHHVVTRPVFVIVDFGQDLLWRYFVKVEMIQIEGSVDSTEALRFPLRCSAI